ncbi:hypothetical protein [Klamath virus]|uniref:Uncharacterized protein n=1 Tax=Klamath virus TaxID=909206 RepID=A0A0D3R1M2_9RHAB|nr:hypothetical protein [Klamath virus]AJR28407.1 hypothetical protein [Klamath virus]
MLGEILIAGICYLLGRRFFWGYLAYIAGQYNLLHYPLMIIQFLLWLLFYNAPYQLWGLIWSTFQSSFDEFNNPGEAAISPLDLPIYRRLGQK